MQLIKQMLAEIKPSKQEEKDIESKVEGFIKKLNKGLKGARAILGGSGAKGTWLSGIHDADIFVCFDYKKFSDKSEQLPDILEIALKKSFKKYSRLHGSRDYFQIKDKDFTFEVVPILKIDNAQDAKNITDVSPLHALWVKRHSRFADEIRLTKQFCKANGIYGAESYIMGFSGYVCEILTIYYKGFLNLAKASLKWKPKTIIDIEKYYKNDDEVLFNLNKSKLTSPLIVIDPVQKDRNASAVMSIEKYDRFIDACRRFLKNQSRESFEIKEITVEELKIKAGKNKLLLIEVFALSGKEDVIGSKLLKAFDFIRKNLDDNEFKIKESDWKWDKRNKSLFWFIIASKPLDEFVERQGPPLKAKKFVEDFKKKHKNTFIKRDRIWAKDRREFIEPKKLVKFLIKDKYLKEKVKSLAVK